MVLLIIRSGGFIVRIRKAMRADIATHAARGARTRDVHMGSDRLALKYRADEECA
ncbi:MAG: hypothetical protein JNJ73_13600 [Hyphomonadaceae bacterium]|nr:hypothetical protein [Hyphomonadaceae bacterium]